jgi:protocatechuate 3,4-dioxygenase beta subunit
MSGIRPFVLVCLVGATVSPMEAPESRRNAATGDEPPRKGANFAYDHPLPDSMRRAIVDVTVVDAESRAPLGCTEVRVLNYVDLKNHSIPTDANGRARIVYPFAEEPDALFEVRKEGFIPQVAELSRLRQQGGSPRRFTIALRRGVTIGGLVTDESGDPIEGVTVVASVDGPLPRVLLPGSPGRERFSEIASRTGPDGRWSTSSCPPDARRMGLQLIHPEYVSSGPRALDGLGLRHPNSEKLRQQADRQTMTKGIRVDGRVVDAEGKPIPGARVVDSRMGITHVDFQREALTDAGGRFHIHCAPGEDMTMLVQVRGYQPTTRTFKARPGLGPVDFRLEPGKTLRGRVVDPAGRPIAGALISLPEGTQYRGVFLRTWTDTEGRFAWEGAPADPMGYMIYRSGYLPLHPVLLTAGDRESIVEMKPALRVTIQAHDRRTGLPIRSFTIEAGAKNWDTGAVAWGAEISWMERKDAARQLYLDATRGPYVFRITSARHKMALSRSVQADERDAEVVVELEKAEPQ